MALGANTAWISASYRMAIRMALGGLLGMRKRATYAMPLVAMRKGRIAA